MIPVSLPMGRTWAIVPELKGLEMTENYAARLGAIIALDVNYCETRFGIDDQTVDHPCPMECAADFASYCLELGLSLIHI